MEITQADLDSLAEKLIDFTDGELAALHFAMAAVAEEDEAEVEGFVSKSMDWATPFQQLSPARFGDITLKRGTIGSTYGGDGVMSEEITVA